MTALLLDTRAAQAIAPANAQANTQASTQADPHAHARPCAWHERRLGLVSVGAGEPAAHPAGGLQDWRRAVALQEDILLQRQWTAEVEPTLVAQ